MDPKQKAELIDSLVTNGCCGDANTLEALDDGALVVLKAALDSNEKNQLAFNAATKEYTDATGAVHTWNATKGSWHVQPKAPEKKEPETTVENEMKIEEPKQLTEEQWMSTAPVSVQNRLKFAEQLETEAKLAIVTKLVANVDEKVRAEKGNKLMEKSLEDLKDMEFLAPAEEKRISNYFGSSAPVSPTENSHKGFAPFGEPHDYIPEAKKD